MNNNKKELESLNMVKHLQRQQSTNTDFNLKTLRDLSSYTGWRKKDLFFKTKVKMNG
jgi:hypothetical protein